MTELYCLSWSGTGWRDPAWPPTIWQNATTTDMFFKKKEKYQNCFFFSAPSSRMCQVNTHKACLPANKRVTIKTMATFVKMMTLLTIWSKTNQSKIVAFTTSMHSCNVLFIFRIGGQRPHMFTHVWLAGKGIAIIVYSPSRQVIVCHPPRSDSFTVSTYHSHLQSLPNKCRSKIE